MQYSYQRINKLDQGLSIDVQYHFIRDKVIDGDIKVEYVHTKKFPADLLSKNVIQVDHDVHAWNITNGTMDCWIRDQGG